MINTLMAQVDGRRLIKTVEGIVTGERLSNAAERRALDYMKAEYEAAGCVAHFEEHLGYVSTPEKASLTVAGEPVDCVTHAMTPSCSGLAAPMTYLSHKDFKGFGPADVAGMIVLTDGLALEPKVRALQEAGAAGVIFITGQFTHTMIVSRVWGSPTPETMDKYVKIPVVSVSYADGQALKAKAAGKPEAVMSTEVWARWTMMPCLVADIPGRTDDFVIMTSHIDSWWLGAFDNASGNAAGIEVARILAPHKDKLVRGVRFINWSGHSQGRYAGSAQYCDFHFEELSEHCVLNVNADCLGGKGATVMTYSPSMACNKGLAMTALSEAAGVTGYEGHRYSRSCDMSFWGPGVPAMYCQVSEQPPVKGAAADAFSALFGGESKTGGFGYWWHTKEDTIDKVDPDVLARDVKVFVSTVWHACADETLPLSAAAEAAELVADIEAWDAMAAGAGRPVDLGLAKARAAELAAALAKLDAELA
ncbi:MAG: M28 family peptidase, partial [Duodenibacillus sp.]|nr:M28 family peptidase [Duodenibacillus sp.]